MFHFLLFFVILPVLAVAVLVCVLPGTGVTFRDIPGMVAGIPGRAWRSWQARGSRDIIDGRLARPGLYARWAEWRDRPRGDGPLGTGKQDREAVTVPVPTPAPPRPARPAPARPAQPRAGRPAVAGPSPAALGRSGPAAQMGAILSTPPPMEWQHLIAYVGSFEPADADEFMAFVHGSAAGVYGLAEALAAFAETCEVVIGLDPLVVQAAYALTDAQADSAQAWLAIARQFLVIYQGILEALENGVTLPHNARQFFGQGGAPAGQAA